MSTEISLQKEKEANDLEMEKISKAFGTETTGEPAPGESHEGMDESQEGMPEEIGQSAEALGDVESLRRQVEDLTRALTELQAAMADDNNGTWRHKYDVLNGKLKAEGPRAAQTIRELKAEVARLQEFISSRGDRVPLDTEEAEIIDELGISEDSYHKLKKKLAPVEHEPQPAANDAGTGAYLAILDARARGWREAMNSEQFRGYLQNNPEIYSALLKADGVQNASAVASIYNDYFAAVSPAKRTSREAAPSNSRGGGVDMTAKNIWTEDMIDDLNHKVASGQLKMGSEKYKKLKASLDSFMENLGRGR